MIGFKQYLKLQERSKELDLLKEYTDFLLEHGYTDTDVYCEGSAIDEFMRIRDKQKNVKN